jgi:hypothetical protein
MTMIPVSKAAELREIATKRTLTRWLVQGVIPGKKLAGLWFVDPEAVQAFLNGSGPALSKPAAATGTRRKGR